MAFRRRLVQPVLPAKLTPLAPPARKFAPAPLGKRDMHTKLAIGRIAAPHEHPVKARQIHMRLGYQGGQRGNDVQRLEYDMRGPVTVRCLQLVRPDSTRTRPPTRPLK